MTLYEVKLVEAGELPAAACIRAEARYAASLERELGGPEQVVELYRSWLAATDAQPEDLSPAEVQAASRWFRAAGNANEAAFRNLGAIPSAHFELRLVRDAAQAVQWPRTEASF